MHPYIESYWIFFGPNLLPPQKKEHPLSHPPLPQCLQCLQCQVAPRKDLTSLRFLKDYAAANRPLIILAARDFMEANRGETPTVGNQDVHNRIPP